ncbi:LolA family protein [Maricaulis sp. D1M11]|uniref:LolA family protein n=1 Tax=Maricaulis sp. D1M11 TaxID=3076117 RepID=UPI0039B476C7
MNTLLTTALMSFSLLAAQEAEPLPSAQDVASPSQALPAQSQTGQVQTDQTPSETMTSPSPVLFDADQALVEINAWMNSIDTLQARFHQVSPDGSYASGLLSIQRPGRLRFDYDDPSPFLIVADGSTVALQDQALETTDRAPLRSTPLWWILKRDIDLSEDAEVTEVFEEAGSIYLGVRDPDGEMDGEILFRFDSMSHALQEWWATDSLGQTTRLSLSEVNTGLRLDRRLFVLDDDGSDSRRGRR